MMNKLMAGVAIALIASGVAYAGDRGHNGKEHVDFAVIDANSDGFVDVAEIEAHMAARFAEVDVNGDGEISLEEMQAKMAEHHGDNASEKQAERLAKRFEKLDTDGSGTLSADERPDRKMDPAKMIERLDEDGDGKVSAEEYENGKGKGRGGKHGGGH